MKFEIERAVEILERTPATLRSMLEGLSDDWTATENPEVWQAFDVLGHLIHGEKTDWRERAEIILKQGKERKFRSFDRFAQFEESKGKTLVELLDTFEEARRENLEWLRSAELSSAELDLEGLHPSFGPVTLRQLMATWVVHDLNHVRQIVTAMARKYDAEVGPWKEYLSILH